MLVRHFGHGVGHLKYERQQEPASEIDATSVPRGDGNHGDNDSSKTEESGEEEDSDAEEPEPGSEGDPVIDIDDRSESDDESEEVEDSDSEGDDDGGYASL